MNGFRLIVSTASVALLLAGCDAGTPDPSPQDDVPTETVVVRDDDGPAATAATVAGAPTAADGTIGLDGTATVKIGTTLAALRSAGVNATITQEPLGEGSTCRYARLAGLDGVSAMLDGERLVRLEVDKADGGWTTPEGAQVGTSEAELKRLYGDRLAVAPHKYTGPTGHYATVIDEGSDRALVFETDGAKVLNWRVGTIEAAQLVEGCA